MDTWNDNSSNLGNAEASGRNSWLTNWIFCCESWELGHAEASGGNSWPHNAVFIKADNLIVKKPPAGTADQRIQLFPQKYII